MGYHCVMRPASVTTFNSPALLHPMLARTLVLSTVAMNRGRFAENIREKAEIRAIFANANDTNRIL
jgi:hypothetical protein